MVAFAFAESIQLVPDGTLFVHVAIILTMVFVLNRILFRPVNRVLDERESRTRGRSGEAREIIRRTEESLLRYEDSLRQARAEGYRLMERQQAEASAARQRRIAEVRREIEAQIEEQKTTIGAQAEDARANLQEDARRVAAEISAHILGR